MKISSLITLGIVTCLSIPITGLLTSVNAANLRTVSNPDPDGLTEIAAAIVLIGQLGNLIDATSSTTVGVIAEAFTTPPCTDSAGDSGFFVSDKSVTCSSTYVDNGVTLNSNSLAQARAVDFFGSRATARARAVGNARAAAFARADKKYQLKIAPVPLTSLMSTNNAVLNISLNNINLSVDEGKTGFLASVKIPELSINWQASGRLYRNRDETQVFNVDGDLSISDFTISEGNATLNPRIISIPINLLPDSQVSLLTNAQSEAEVRVPESSTILSLLAFGTLGAGVALKQKLKISKSTEKETTKVG